MTSLAQGATVDNNQPQALAVNIPNVPAPLPSAPMVQSPQPAIPVPVPLPAAPNVVSNNNTPLNSFLTASDSQKYNGSTYIRYNLYKQPGEINSFITIPTAPWLNAGGVIDPITESTIHESLKTITTFVSGGVEYAITSSSTLNPSVAIGLQNAFYNGSKLTSADFNINSPDTFLGGPVVTIRQSSNSSLSVNPDVVVS